jgi:hypothetical protein
MLLTTRAEGFNHKKPFLGSEHCALFLCVQLRNRNE